MKKLFVVLAVLSLVGCGVTNNIDAKDAALGFQLCQVFQVNPISIERSVDKYRKIGISHSVTAYCEGGLTVTFDVPVEKENPKGNV